jgi:transposase-like protein
VLPRGEVLAMPRPYPAEFRQRALGLVRSGGSVAEVAGLFGITALVLPIVLSEHCG